MFKKWITNLHNSVPNLILADRVVQKMVSGAQRYLQDETGEAMVGMIDPGKFTGGVPTIYVLDTIPPDETHVVREFYSFEQGDERQYEIFTWLMENWNVQRKKFTGTLLKFDAPLAHVGDWHKQPGAMIAPSQGDLMSALLQLDSHTEDESFLLVPIVTLGHKSPTQSGATSNHLAVKDANGTYTRIDFWYIDTQVRRFLPINPVVYPDAQVPPTFPLPWHIAHEVRAEAEIDKLEAQGFSVSPVVLWNVDKRAPVEVCLMLSRPNTERMWLIVTSHKYPAHSPKIFAVKHNPLHQTTDWYEAFESAWATARHLPLPKSWQWTPERFLIDAVRTASLNQRNKKKD